MSKLLTFIFNLTCNTFGSKQPEGVFTCFFCCLFLFRFGCEFARARCDR